MRTGKIYRIYNNLNGKSYIGQTIRDINIRINRHLKDTKYDNDDYYIHRAIKKYGFENFSVHILEDNIDLKCLDERERFWIKYYHTYINDVNCNGYNMTQGGDSLIDVNRKLSDDDLKEIKNLLKNNLELRQIDIANMFNISFYAISDINIGKSWFDKNENYPLRKNEFHDVTYDEFLMIIEMLKLKLFSLNYIAKKLGTSQSIVSNINTGKYSKYNYPENIVFPLIDRKIVSDTKISTKNTLLLLLDYMNNFTRRELADKYNISVAYVKTIVCLKNKLFLEDLKFPLKDYKEYNIKIINHKLSKLKEFK